MVATSGNRLISEDALEALKHRLLPLATVATPNIPEAEILSGLTIRGPKDMVRAARVIGEIYGCTLSSAIAAGLAVGIAAAGGAVGMGLATAKSAEGIARQPEAEGKIRTMMMLGLVFIETAIIYALLVVILIIFVL